MIEVKNLTKKYGNHYAVDHLNFTIEEGRIYGFLGPNGAGKSTTMNMITGYIASTEGTVTINGHDILEEPEEAKKCIGYLPELPPLYFDMTVLEYLKFVAELKGVPKSKRPVMIDDVMGIVKIKDMKNRLIKNLSKGYRQRVGIAQALMGYPEIVILDEPTVGLDPKQIIEIRDLIKSLSKKHTVILSSHILAEVSAVCDYIMIISHGKLVASDTPDNLSRLMAGENSLEITVKTDKNYAWNALQSIPEIEKIEVADGTEPGTADLKIKTIGDADVREQIFFKMASFGYPILRMESIHVSLEDVFLELTSDKKGKKKKNAAKVKKEIEEMTAEKLLEAEENAEEPEDDEEELEAAEPAPEENEDGEE